MSGSISLLDDDHSSIYFAHGDGIDQLWTIGLRSMHTHRERFYLDVDEIEVGVVLSADDRMIKANEGGTVRVTCRH